MRRLRSGELLAGAGAAGLIGSLFLDASGDADGWSALGWLMVTLLVLAALAGLWLVVATVRRTVTQAVTAAVTAASFGVLVLLVLVVRVLTLSDAGAGAWIGLLLATLIPAGGWWSLADERTGSAESRYVPPAPRPIPPPSSSPRA